MGSAGRRNAASAVLILTERLDPTADLVVTELDRRGVPVVRLDTADFPTALAVAARFDGAWTGTLRTATRTLDLAAVRGAYYRRPGAFVLPEGMTQTDREWAELEARVGLGGLLATIPTWLNHPSRVGYAEYKPVQLAAAAASGLLTPRTLVTNDPDAARSFAAELGGTGSTGGTGATGGTAGTAGTGGIVYKPFSSVTEREGRRAFVYTSPVVVGDLADEAVRHTAHLFQERIEKAYEVRLTVVGEEFFAARLTAGSAAAAVDWRSDYAAVSYAVTRAPEPVQAAARRLLSGLGLRFAAMDFAVTPAGEWYFLDLNPNGQWAWIEDETGLPICSAIADALTR